MFSEQNFPPANFAPVPNPIGPNLVSNQIRINTGGLQSPEQPVIIVIPNPSPVTNSLGISNSTFRQEDQRRTGEEREISAQGQLDNQDGTMDDEDQEDPLRLSEPVSGESPKPSAIMDHTKGESESEKHNI